MYWAVELFVKRYWRELAAQTSCGKSLCSARCAMNLDCSTKYAQPSERLGSLFSEETALRAIRKFASIARKRVYSHLREAVNTSRDTKVQFVPNVWRCVLPAIRKVLPWVWACRAKNSEFAFLGFRTSGRIVSTSSTLQHFEMPPLAHHT
jgi:hypothetical protein